LQHIPKSERPIMLRMHTAANPLIWQDGYSDFGRTNSLNGGEP
jgi:hypothetical protein